VNWFSSAAGAAAGLVAASCHKNTRKLRAFIPRRLVRIVTVNPSKRFYYKRFKSTTAGPISSSLTF
jgi:hypothetical protein